jgi:ElaB/YqjD/DUF883 family membrane-anchored ribosome-binding protein
MSRTRIDDMDDAQDQIAALRDQVETLMRERVNPAMQQARETVQDQAEMLSDRVRDQPLMALAVAAAVGFLLGRISS